MNQVVLTKIDGKEGWGANAEIVIQVNQQVTSRFPVFQPEKRFEIPVEGLLRVISKEQATHCWFGSVTVNTRLLPSNEAVWLPLFDTGNDEVLEFPCEEMAAAWIELTPANKVLSAVAEVTEPSDSERSLRSLVSIEEPQVYALMKQICEQEAAFRKREHALLKQLQEQQVTIAADKAVIDRLLNERHELHNEVLSLKYGPSSLEGTLEHLKFEPFSEDAFNTRANRRTAQKSTSRAATPKFKRDKIKQEMLVPYRERKARRLL